MTVVRSSGHEDPLDIDVMQVGFSCHLANVTTLSIGREFLKAQIAVRVRPILMEHILA